MTNYYNFVQELAEQKKTSGNNQSESLIHYTELSAQRMKRWMKIGQILPEVEERLKSIKKPQKWILLTESWCGDAAHTIMFIEKMADLNDAINLEWKLRDENLELMDKYLTNGGRSIPKLIAFDQNGKELFNWGPRPRKIQEAFLEMKAQNLPYEEVSLELQKLYNEDKGVSVQLEIVALMSDAKLFEN